MIGPNVHRDGPRRMIDRLPPQSIEAEQSVLGAILIDRDAVIEVAEFLRPEDFYRQAHGRSTRPCSSCSSGASRSTSSPSRRPSSGTRQLETSVAGRYLSSHQPDADRRPRRPVRPDRRAQGGPAEPHRRGRPDRRHRLRGPGRGPGGDRPRRVGAVRRQPRAGHRRLQPLGSLLHAAYDRLDYLHAHRGEISGVRTGFKDLDALTTGFQKSDLIVVAARPSVGKTSFALNIAEHAAVRESGASACSASR